MKRRIKFLDTGKSYEIQISVFIYKVELKHNLLAPLCIGSGCFHSTVADLRGYNKGQWLQSPKSLLSDPLQKMRILLRTFTGREARMDTDLFPFDSVPSALSSAIMSVYMHASQTAL